MSKRIHAEVMINNIIGMGIGWLIVRYLFPLFDHLNQDTVATISTIIFFISSYGRSWILRVIFENKNNKDTI